MTFELSKIKHILQQPFVKIRINLNPSTHKAITQKNLLVKAKAQVISKSQQISSFSMH